MNKTYLFSLAAILGLFSSPAQATDHWACFASGHDQQGRRVDSGGSPQFESQSEAESYALDQCRFRGGIDCRIDSCSHQPW